VGRREGLDVLKTIKFLRLQLQYEKPSGVQPCLLSYTVRVPEYKLYFTKEVLQFPSRGTEFLYFVYFGTNSPV
jgi:hypothetical protein